MLKRGAGPRAASPYPEHAVYYLDVKPALMRFHTYMAAAEASCSLQGVIGTW